MMLSWLTRSTGTRRKWPEFCFSIYTCIYMYFFQVDPSSSLRPYWARLWLFLPLFFSFFVPASYWAGFWMLTFGFPNWVLYSCLEVNGRSFCCFTEENLAFFFYLQDLKTGNTISIFSYILIFSKLPIMDCQKELLGVI